MMDISYIPGTSIKGEACFEEAYDKAGFLANSTSTVKPLLSGQHVHYIQHRKNSRNLENAHN